MRQFALWNKPITHSLDTLKWQIQCLRHSLTMRVQQTADLNGFPLYLHLPSGCFGFLELWRLKRWYLCIISSKVKVRTQGKVHRHAMLECQWYWLIGTFRNHTDSLNTHGAWASTEGEKNDCKTDLHEYNTLAAMQGKTEFMWNLKISYLSRIAQPPCFMPGMYVVALLCNRCEVGRKPRWWCANDCSKSLSWWEFLNSIQSIGKSWSF